MKTITDVTTITAKFKSIHAHVYIGTIGNFVYIGTIGNVVYNGTVHF